MPGASDRIGEYELLSRLGSGGMAEVFLARPLGARGFHRAVVLKRMLPRLAHDPVFIQMFLDEAEAIASLDHPNIVGILELRDDDGLYMVMEYLEGESLSAVSRRRLAVDRQPMASSTVAYIVACVCAALEAVHNARTTGGERRPIIHRDVAPENIFITYSGHIKLLDFGVAWMDNRLAETTSSGQVKGRYSYMSPEQINRERLDGRTDLFSLGVVAHELMTGERLFKRHSEFETLRAVREEPIPRPSERLPSVDPGLERIVLRALERNRDARYPSAREMRLEALQLHEPSVAGPPEELLASQMQRLFAHQIEARQRLLTKARRRSDITTGNVPAELDALQTPSSVGAASVSNTAAETGTVGLRSGRFLTALFSVLSGVVILGGVLAWLVWPRPATEPPPAGRDPVAALPPATARHVELDLLSAPAGAEVLVKGQVVGVTPHHLRLPRSNRPVELTLRRRGYVARTTKVVPSASIEVHLELTPEPPVAQVSPAQERPSDATPPKKSSPSPTENRRPPPTPKYERFD